MIFLSQVLLKKNEKAIICYSKFLSLTKFFLLLIIRNWLQFYTSK